MRVPVRTVEACDIDALRRHFAEYGQEHVFRFFDDLDETGRERLARQAEGLDLASIQAAWQRSREHTEPGVRQLEPAPILRLPEHGGDPAAFEQGAARGQALLASGCVAALVVAGGQGTRLGFEGPKGSFPIGPVTERSLFEIQAQKIRGLRRRYGKSLPWYVMTSPATDAETRAVFEAADHFELPANDVVFFCQGTVPGLDPDGRLILERRDRIAESPDGHGGSLTALANSGALEDMQQRGVTTIAYYQVDNPLVQIADPAYLGCHALAEAEISCKVIRKLDPMEKMGVVARVDGRIGIVEYTELDDAHRHARDAEGELVYWAGSIAGHLLDTDFVERVASRADELLPFHASAKKIPCIDPDGRPVQPEEPNGYKLERFVFDALPAARRVAIMEVRREDEYAPVKNAQGADSPATSRQALVDQYRRWLEAGGISPPDTTHWIEVDHSVIDGPEDARRSGLRDIAEAGETIRIGHGATL